MTAAFHGKADKKGKSDAEFLDEVFAFAMGDYLMALSRGYAIDEPTRQRIAERLAAYSGISAEYYLSHGLTIAKQVFNRELLPGQLLDANDTRIASSLPPSSPAGPKLPPFAALQKLYADYMQHELKVNLSGLDYQVFAPDSFDSWDWGSGCNQYLQSSDLCNPKSSQRSIFMDYDWPETLKHEFEYPKFRTMIIAGNYDGLSSIGTHRYLAAQLGFPADRFSLHEYAAGHATAADPQAQPQVLKDVKGFLTKY
jgi:pimeloyl-ACP methyl ester carboxylesterase